MKNQPSLDPRLSSGLLYPVYLPYNTDESKLFYITWLAQLISAIFATIIYSGFDTFISMVVIHIIGQFAALGISLKNLVKDSINKSNQVNVCIFRKKLTGIVKHHERLNR